MLERREVPTTPGTGRALTWVRADDSVGDDPVRQACALAFATDTGTVTAVRALHPKGGGDGWSNDVFMGASLDHAVWFHRPVRTDRWVLIDVKSESLTGVRGLTIGRVFDDEGRHVATVAQEALLRERVDVASSGRTATTGAWPGRRLRHGAEPRRRSGAPGSASPNHNPRRTRHHPRCPARRWRTAAPTMLEPITANTTQPTQGRMPTSAKVPNATRMAPPISEAGLNSALRGAPRLLFAGGERARHASTLRRAGCDRVDLRPCPHARSRARRALSPMQTENSFPSGSASSAP